jgi:phosphomethylpyrimidine synthase
LYYAKQGIITPEMEYIAISENQRIEQLNSNQSDAVPTSRAQLGSKHT